MGGSNPPERSTRAPPPHHDAGLEAPAWSYSSAGGIDQAVVDGEACRRSTAGDGNLGVDALDVRRCGLGLGCQACEPPAWRTLLWRSAPALRVSRGVRAAGPE